MKIALCQINTTTADIGGNVERCIEAINEVLAKDPDLIILPENALCGPIPQDIFFDDSFIEALGFAAQDLAEIHKDCPPILFGNPIKGVSEKRINAAILAQAGKLETLAHQANLWDFDIHFDSRWYKSSSYHKTFTIKGTTILPLIGKDLFHIKNLNLSEKKHDLIIGLCNCAYSFDALKLREENLGTITKPLIHINQFGGNDSLIYDGRSAAHLPGKDTIYHNAFCRENFMIDLNNMPRNTNKIDSQEAEWAEAITLGIADFFEKNGLEKAFFGISGGIDSAIVAYLSKQALGADQITALVLPSRFNQPQSSSAAKQLCDTLGIQYEDVSIEPFFQTFEKGLPSLCKKDAVSENIQARIRALILMAYVNYHGGVLLNTSNKTELSLGYGTLYGDLAGTLSPIGDLTKPQVYQLAKWINRDTEIIPSFIIERQPSAELKLDQVDPFDYPVISPIIEDLVQKNQSNPLMRSTEHKRAQFGTILRLSHKAFGPGRKMPITRK